MNLKSIITLWMLGLLLTGAPSAGMAENAWDKTTPTVTEPLNITVYRSPSCKCCGQWLEHMSKHGFQVTDMPQDDMNAIKTKLGVPTKLASCHTAVINGYLIEGHVPAGDVKKLLMTKPAVAGISVPGMVSGSPGMEMGGKKDPFTVLSFDKAGNSAKFSEYSDY